MTELVIPAGGPQPYFGWLGDGYARFFGQEIVALGTTMDELTFYPDIAQQAGDVTLRVLIVSIDANSNKTDQILFTSAPITVKYNPGESLLYNTLDEYRTITVDLNDTLVTAGQRYGIVWEYLPVGDADGGIKFAAHQVVDAGGDLSYANGSSLNALQFTKTFDFDVALRLKFNSPNTAPTALADAANATEDGGPVNIAVLANDTDPDSGDTKTLVSVNTAGTIGTVSINPNGTVTYNPGANFQSLKAGETTTTSFGYTMADRAGVQSSATVTVTITGTNDAPLAVDDALTIYEDGGPVSLNVLANDSDPDGDPLTLFSVGRSGDMVHIGLSANPNGEVTLDLLSGFQHLKAGESIARTINYTVRDPGNASDIGVVNVTIVGVNDAPTAPALADRSFAEDTLVSFQIAAFNDIDGDALTYTATLANGEALPAWLSFDAATLTFSGTPPTNYNGVIALKVTASDGTLSASDIFDLTITPVNDAPLAVDDELTIYEDGGPASLNVLVNDSDPDGDPLTLFSVGRSGDMVSVGLSANPNGDVTLDLLSGFQYLKAGETIARTINYTVRDSDDASDFGVVNVTIVGANDAPTAPALADRSFAEDTHVSFQTAAFNDIDGDALTYAASLADDSALPTWLSFDAATRTFSGTPPADFNGVLSLKVTASDGALSASDTFDLTITPVNDAPVAVDDELTISEDAGPVSVNLLANDTDADGDDLDLVTLSWPGGVTVANVNFPAGTFTLGLDSSFQSLKAGETATRTLTYSVRDPDGAIDNGALLKVTIVGANDSPTAVALADQTFAEDAPVSFSVAAFTDVDGDALTYTATLETGEALPAWLSFDGATRAFTGTPPANFNGVIVLKVTASDGTASASDVFNLTITPVNDAPTAPGLADRTSAEDSPVIVEVAAFSDVDGDVLTYSASLADGTALPGWLSFNATTRTFSGTPPVNFNGVLALKVTASDGALSASDTFDLTITPVNDAPTAVADAIGVFEDATSGNLVATLLANDTDPDAGDTKTITAVGTGATKGTVTFSADAQTLTYSADHEDFDLLGAFGGPNTATDTFTYTVIDSGGLTSTATVTVTITGVADGVRINGGAAAQVHQGGDGEDTIFGFGGHDSIYGFGGSDSLNGGSGNDIVDGGAGHDRLLGDSGNDWMYGGSGRDTLWGDSGNDTLDGGAGDDVMSSGSGYDIFVFKADQGGDRDIVTDFNSADRIRLEDGLTLASADSGADATGDGVRDTVLTLSDGHEVVLSGFTAWSPGYLLLG